MNIFLCRDFSNTETLCSEQKYYCETCCSKQEAQKRCVKDATEEGGFVCRGGAWPWSLADGVWIQVAQAHSQVAWEKSATFHTVKTGLRMPAHLGTLSACQNVCSLVHCVFVQQLCIECYCVPDGGLGKQEVTGCNHCHLGAQGELQKGLSMVITPRCHSVTLLVLPKCWDFLI